MTIPNILCGTRLALVPALLVIAWRGHAEIYIGALVLAFFLDLIDGPIARWTGQITELGPKLDSWVDFAVFVSLPLGVWWLWPEIILQEWVFVGMMLGSLLLPVLAGFVKFRGTTSYHTWLAKLAVACTSVSIVLLLLGGPDWPLRMAAVICVLAAVEQLAITWLLERPASDVQTLYHVVKRQMP